MGKRLRKAFAETVSADSSVGVYGSFDIVGDIAITKLPCASPAEAKEVARVIMDVNKRVKAVFIQTSAVAGDFRVRGLTYAAGDNRTLTVHKESGCLFAVDVGKCYFSPRLLHERQRIAHLVQPNETVINMFAGVGCFSILIAKRQPTAKVYSIDMNPIAIQFMKENIRVNRVFNKVFPLLGDAKEIIENQLQHCADRVLMPLPEKAYEYLSCAVSALKPSGGWIHIHTFEYAAKAEDPAEKVRRKVTETLSKLNVNFEVPLVRVVRSTGPNWWHFVADVHVKKMLD